MKNVFLTFIVSCMCIFVVAREKKVLNISNSVSVIKQTAHSGQNFEGLLGDLKSMNDLYDIYKLDIFSCYGISGYDTDLKRKVFRETAEGQRLTNELKIKRQDIMNSKLYYIFPFDANRGWSKNYNLKTRTLDFSYIVDADKFISIQGYINFPQLIIKCSPTIKQYNEKRYNSNTNRYSYLNTIKIPMSEKVALPIEENIDNMALVVECKIQQMKYTSRQVSFFNLTTYCLQGVSTNIYIIDEKTSEVYFSLIPITSTSRLLGNVSNENGEIFDLTSSQRICKGMINDLDGYTNIRKSNSVNSEIIGKIVDREVFTYWETNDNWYIVQTAKGIKGYVHKSRIKPVEERNEQKIRYYKVKNGDKIQDIAEKLGVSIDTICKLNRVKITTVLREGQALRISR